MEPLKVGDTLYYISRYSNQDRRIEETVVTKIGRKYATTSHNQILLDTLYSKPDGYSAIRYFRNKQEIENDQWVDGNVYGISDSVRAVRDINILKQIAELTGYKERKK